MLPSPSRLTDVDLSRPIQPATHYAQTETVEEANSALIQPTSIDASVLNSLPLGLALLQKIYNLLQTSQEIENLARQWMNGHIDEHEVASQIEKQGLEETYESMRRDVEAELQEVWVNAGHLPHTLVKFPPVDENRGIPTPTTLKFRENEKAMEEEEALQIINNKYTVDKALKAEAKKDKKRKRDNVHSDNLESTAPATKKPAQKAKAREEKKEKEHKTTDTEVSSAGEDSDWSYPAPVQPVGIVAMIPLDKSQGKKMKAWDWSKATGERSRGRGRGRGQGRERATARGRGRGRGDATRGGRGEGEMISPRGSRGVS